MYLQKTAKVYDLKDQLIRGAHFDQVSKKLGKNCGFFYNSIFIGHMSIVGPHNVDQN